MSNNAKRVINVHGTARSGSTMLDLMLGHDPAGFSLGEVCNWFLPYRSHHFDIKCACGSHPCPVWNDLRVIRERRFHQETLRLLDAEFLVDSSKYLPWIIDVNEAGNRSGAFEVLNVLIYKDPVTLHHSYEKRGKDGVETVLRAYKTYSRFFDTGLPFVAINYAELTRNPDGVLRQLCEILGIPYFQGKEKFWNKTHHCLFGSNGVRKQLRSGESRIYREEGTDHCQKVDRQAEQKLRDNDALVDVWRRLHENQAKYFSTYPSVKGRGQIKKGVFYYKSKLCRRIKRLHPEQHSD